MRRYAFYQKVEFISFEFRYSTMKNRIVFLAFVALFVACAPEIDNTVQIKNDIDYLASDELEGRETGTEGERLAAEYISKRMQTLGLEPMGEEDFIQQFEFRPKKNPHVDAVDSTADPITVSNVLGLWNNNADNTIIIGAHYDHLGHGIFGSLNAEKDSAIHNGADDNASGVALVLQLAERLKSMEQTKDNNYLFIAFSGEEIGLLGSNYFAKNPTIELEKVNYMINFDMVGRLDTAKGIAINGVGTSTNWKQHLEAANWDNFKLIYGESGVGPSDHTSFYLQDIPVLHFFTGQHSDYHKPSDDVEKINLKGIDQIAGFIARLIQETNPMAKLDFLKTKQDTSETPRWTVSLGVMPDYMFQGEGMRIDGITEGRPASIAGFEKGDIVIQMDTLKVVGMQSYMKGLSLFEKGDSTMVKVKRGEEEVVKMVRF